MSRIWARCLRAEGLSELVEGFGDGKAGSESVLGKAPVMRGEEWKLSRCNERMRFLRYGEGQFFFRKCDDMWKATDRGAKPDCE